MAMASPLTGAAAPEWLSKGDNAWQMTSAVLVGLQCMPGMVIFYAGAAKRKWAVNSAFMAAYAFAVTFPCWAAWAYAMSFGDRLLPFWGKAAPAVTVEFLISQATLPCTAILYPNSTIEVAAQQPYFPAATLVFFQAVFAAFTAVLLTGAVIGRMSLLAWTLFVPLWLTFSYTISAFSLWGGGFLFQWGAIDYSGGYVIHLACGTAGFTTAYWVGPRSAEDRDQFPPNDVLLMLAGAGLVWTGWAGFNGGDPYAANVDAPLAVLNTNVCAATSLLVWVALDVIFSGKPSVMGAVQGMNAGLVCITSAAGIVEGWAAIAMGVLAGGIPWFTMTVVQKRVELLRRVDDALGGIHTIALPGLIGGVATGVFAEPRLCDLYLPVTGTSGVIYGSGMSLLLKQLAAAMFIVGWNVTVTTAICLVIQMVVPLRMTEELAVGDEAVISEEPYAVWGEG